MSDPTTTPGQEAPFTEEKVIVVDPGQVPVRIDRFLVDKTMRISRSRIQEGVKTGAVTVNGEMVKSNYKVNPGDEIKLLIPRQFDVEKGLLPQEIPLEVVYEDADVLVINKAAGMVVHPGIGNHEGTLVNALAHYLQDVDLPVAAGNPENRPGLVHRIDKDTSGLLVVAKTPWAMTHLAKQFFDHSVQRRYVALVWGSPEPAAGTIHGSIARDTADRRKMAVTRDPEEGKKATTHYRTLEDLYYVSLLECQLETGRTHQIRVHMQNLGHPLFNDSRYGGERIRKGTVFTKYRRFVENTFEVMPRQALHARTLGFVHPTTGIAMKFECPLPDDFEAALTRWRHYLSSRKEALINEL
ncbi:MAG: RluA family pseudouridine synthase [Saprospiraceae bacterium]